MVLLLACALAAEAAKALPQPEPLVAHWLRLLGLTDLTGSTGFICILSLLALNLVCGVAKSLSELWAESPTDEKSQLRSELETHLDKSAFTALALRFASQRLGRAPIMSPVAGGFELSAKRGSLNALLHSLAHLSFGVALAGMWMMRAQGFEARVLVEEGARSHAAELLRGHAPDGWKAYPSASRSQAHTQVLGYFDPGFEIERVPGLQPEQTGASLFRIYESGKLVGSAVVSPGKPASFRSLRLHLLESVPGSAQGINVSVTSSSNERGFTELSLEQSVDLEDFKFRVTQIQPRTDLNGPAAEIEYLERGKAPERFWVFVDFPDYDFAHRRNGKVHFTLNSIRSRQASVLQIGSEPGAVWLWGGLTALALLFWATMARPEEKFWIRWTEGKPDEAGPAVHKVELLGWSRRPLLFEPRFYALAERLERRIEKVEAPDVHDART